MKKGRRKIDLREEYFRLSGGPNGAREDAWQDWEPKRIPRPEGQAEWGVGLVGSGSYVEESSNTREYRGKRSNGRLQAEGAEPSPISSPVGAASQGNRTVITASGERLVIGPDGKPCRACSTKLAFADAMRGAAAAGGKGSGGSNSQSLAATAAAAGGAAASVSPSMPAQEGTAGEMPCPPDVEELGRSTWNFLHSVAATYPEEPSKVQRQALLSLLTSLPHLYPCSSCADALREEYARRMSLAGRSESGLSAMTPTQAIASKNLATCFLCSIHNEVNKRLGKPTWDCENLENLKQRWEDGGTRCY